MSLHSILTKLAPILSKVEKLKEDFRNSLLAGLGTTSFTENFLTIGEIEDDVIQLKFNNVEFGIKFLVYLQYGRSPLLEITVSRKDVLFDVIKWEKIEIISCTIDQLGNVKLGNGTHSLLDEHFGEFYLESIIQSYVDSIELPTLS